MDVDAAEKLVQLAIGALCVVSLVYFTYLEMILDSAMLSDRAFYLLVTLAVASLGLRELQYFTGHRSPPGDATGANDRATDNTDDTGGSGGSGGTNRNNGGR
jgi:hypothetical protein